MNPTPQAIAAIETYVAGLSGGWAGNTDSQVATAANLPAVANPAPRATVPTPFTLAGLLGQLGSASLEHLASFTGLAQLQADVNAQNIPNCVAWCGFLAAAAVITSGEAAAIAAIVTATELDPSWPVTVGWAQATIGRPLDLNDSAIARAS